jgi:antirestriction protein ArdC
MTKKQRLDIHQIVTDQIIAKLEEGTAKWKKSWATVAGGLPLRENGQPYKGINVLILMIQGRSNPNWLTYKKASELKGQVRSGESGTKVVFFKSLTVEDKVTGEDRRIPMLRSFTVFNAEQIDDLPDRLYPKADERHSAPRLDDADAYITATGAVIAHGGDRAFYAPSRDSIQLPEFDTFDSPVAYYGTAFHELVHWTGAETRVDRDIKNSFGTPDYAREELVAELGAAFIAATMNIETEVRDDHAEYLAAWLKVLKEDKKAIFKAAAAAQKAVDFLDGLQPVAMEEAA